MDSDRRTDNFVDFACGVDRGKTAFNDLLEIVAHKGSGDHRGE